MSMLQAVTAWLAGCPYLSEENGAIHIEYADINIPQSYALSSTGENVLRMYIDGTAVLEQNFVMYARNYTLDDAERIDNSGFVEDFARWIRAQNVSRSFPVGAEFESITVSNGMLYDLDESGTAGTYQIQLRAVYTI